MPLRGSHVIGTPSRAPAWAVSSPLCRLLRQRILTAGLQFCGEDHSILHHDLVKASVLGPQVLDLEVVAFPQSSQTVLGLVIKAIGNHLTILKSERMVQGLHGSKDPPSLASLWRPANSFLYWSGLKNNMIHKRYVGCGIRAQIRAWVWRHGVMK